MSDTKWLTYDELAQALGINADSARRLVARKKWPRQPGNDGKARIGVPVERLTEKTPAVGHDIAADISPDSPPDAGGDITLTVRVLAQHIDRLEKELEAVKVERDVERERAGQVDALRAALEARDQQLADLRADRDRWAAQAERLAIPAPVAAPAEAPRPWWPFKR